MTAQLLAFPNDDSPVVARLDESERRVLGKTVAFLNLEYTKSPKAADSYMRNLTPRQVEVIQRCVSIAKEIGMATPRELLAFKNYGYDV